MKWSLIGVGVFMIVLITGWLIVRASPESEEGSSSSVDESAVTQVVPFDAGDITSVSAQSVVNAQCAQSQAVPREGAFACQTSTGSLFDPCFILENNLLMCEPNPGMDSYQAIVTSSTIPETYDSSKEPTAFIVQFEDGLTCEILSVQKEVGTLIQTYTCNAPSSGIAGELNTTEPLWTAEFFTQNTTTGEITYGPEVRPISTAWVW